MPSILKTLNFKLRNPPRSFLEQGSFEVNQVWNYSNQTSFLALRRYVGPPTFLSTFDLDKLTGGVRFDETENPDGFTVIKQSVVHCINQELVTRKHQFKKSKLKFRTSQGSRKKLGLDSVQAKKHLDHSGRTSGGGKRSQAH